MSNLMKIDFSSLVQMGLKNLIQFFQFYSDFDPLAILKDWPDWI